MIKFFKQPHIIKITTIIITIVLCFNFLPSKVYAYPEKHNIENSRSKKENTKNNILKRVLTKLLVYTNIIKVSDS